MLLLLASLASASSAYPPPRAELVLGGARSTTMDLYRPAPGADKVYVKVGLPDGSEALFLLDTGAAISVMHRDVIEQLGLPVTTLDGRIEGLSGSVEWRRAVVPRITLGHFQLNALDVAVDVPGVPTMAGALPVAGILGNNVWTNFTCEIDYPADSLILHAPGTYRVPKRAAPLVVDGTHAYTAVAVRAADGTKATVALEVDTGAHDLMFYGATGEPFRGSSTEGVEPVIGVGADLDELPLASFLQVTRRVPLSKIRFAGLTLSHPTPARWYGADGGGRRTDLPGLLGYGPMAEHVAILDFPGQQFLLKRSKRVRRRFDALGSWLEVERAAHGDDPARAAVRGRLQYAMGDVEAARKTLLDGLTALPADAELSSLISWIYRNERDWAASLAALDATEPTLLAEEREWVAYIDSLFLDGQVERALQEARAGLEAVPADSDVRDDVFVALSDALLASGEPAQAAAAIAEAAENSPGGSAHLLRKARAAMAERDRYGAMVALRDLWTVYPLNGVPMWLYATLASPDDLPGFVVDMDNALRRLHPGDEPWDFVGAALLTAGEETRGREALDRGYARDCAPMAEGPDRQNCDAWYWALGGTRLDEAKQRVDAAITERPWASAFHDTAAAVAYASGDGVSAREHALLAARLSPGDPYLLWQLDRIEAKFPR